MPLKKKVSYGIICFRRNAKNTLQLLMIKKATTYHFSAFVNGYYSSNPNNPKSDKVLKKLFNNMTYHEKLDILSFNFKTLWQRIYRGDAQITISNSYNKKEYKFNSLCNNKTRVMNLIKNSTNVETIWEFPKGRKNTDVEFDLNTAQREFLEETNLRETDYIVRYHISPYIQTYTDFGRAYQNIYYLADMLSNTLEPKTTFFNKWQMSEICDIRWISKEELANMNLEEITYNRLMKSFTKIIKKYRAAS